MLQVNDTAALAALNTYLNGASGFGEIDFSSFAIPTVNGAPVTSYFGGSTGSAQALQLSSTQIAVEFPENPANLFLLVHGSGMSLPLTTLNGPVELQNAGGAVTEIDLYSGGAFNVNALSGGTQIGTLTLSSTEYTLTSGNASVTLAGSGLPTTLGTVESILSGSYSGPDLSVSQITVNDGSATGQLSLSSSGYTFTDGSESITLSGSGLPTSLSASQIDGLVTHQPLSWLGGDLSVSQLQVSSEGHTLTAALTSTSLTLTFDNYSLTLNGDFPTTFTSAELTSLLNGGQLPLPEGAVSSASLTNLSTGEVIESATSGVAGGSPLTGFTAALNGGLSSELVHNLMLAVDGGVLVGPSDSAEVTTSGTYVDGHLLAAGQYVVVDGGYEVVQSGATATHTVVEKGWQFVLSGATAVGTEVDAEGDQLLSIGSGSIPGGAASGTVVNSGGIIELQASSYSNPPPTVTGLTLNPGGQIDFLGYTPGSVSLTQSGSTLTFSSGSSTIAEVGLANVPASALTSITGPYGLAAFTVPNTLTPSGDNIITVTSDSNDFVVTDFSPGERIDLAGLNLFHSFSSLEAAASQVGSYTVINLGSGALILDNVQLSSLTAADFILTTSSSDFGQTGQDGVLFRDAATGDMGYMTSNASGGETWHPIGPTGPGWTTLGLGDFNGDGLSDVGFRNTSTGEWGFMTVNPSGGETWHDVGPTSLAYSEAGTGDFLGTGQADVAFVNTTTGDFGFMSVNASGSEVWHPLGPTSTAYTAYGAGDFLGDGLIGVLFRNNTTGDMGFMTANPAGGETWHPIGPTGTGWAVIGIGDFDGSGQDEVAFRNTSTGEWGYMTANASGNGETWHDVGPTSLAYSVLKVGDFDNSGHDEIAFRSNSTGAWGYMAANTSGGGEVWHDVGATSLDYYAL